MKQNIIVKVGVLVENNGKLLLIREKKKLDGKYYWNIIKGTFESKNDRDFLETALRECQEEAGILVKTTGLLDIICLKRRDCLILQFNFIAAIKNGAPCVPNSAEQEKRGEDIIKVKYFSRDDLRNMAVKKFMDKRTRSVVQSWLKGQRSDLSTIKLM